jgi:uncharacterized protein YcaQ
VGLLWNKPSDALMGIGALNSTNRNVVFEHLLNKSEITPIRIEGIKDRFYCLTAELPLLEEAMNLTKRTYRCEFIAPLDNLIWDRKIIKAIFDFDYKWEIYTPQEKRKYGYYTLPVLYGDAFVGRVEIICDRKSQVLTLKNFWAEDGFRSGKAFERAFEKKLAAFAKFNECAYVN